MRPEELGVSMESIVVTLIGGVVTLVGVVLSNSRGRAVMEVKIDELPRRVEKHNGLVERTYRLEQDMALVRRDVDALEERAGSERVSQQQRVGLASPTHGGAGRAGRYRANVDLLMGCAPLDPTWRAVCVALVMAVLSPVMAAPGKADAEGGGSHE